MRLVRVSWLTVITVVKCFMWSTKLLTVKFFKEVYIAMNISRSMLAHIVSCLSVHLQKQPPEVFYNKRCSIIKLCARVSFLIKTLAQMFSCEFCEISKNNFFTEHFWATASASRISIWLYQHCVFLINLLTTITLRSCDI